jgi:hypothetical protein
VFKAALDGSSVVALTDNHYIYAATANDEAIFWADLTDRIYAVAK